MKRRILFFFLFFGLSLAIAYPIHAATLKVKTKKTQTVKAGTFKDKRINIYFKGKNVTDLCKIKFKGVKKKTIYFYDALHQYSVDADNLTKRKTKVKFIISFSPEKYDDEYGWADYDYDDDYVDSDTFGRMKDSDYFKTYKKTITVTFKKKYKNKPSLDVWNFDYFTRSNKFKMTLMNLSNRTVTILANAKVLDKDYKSYDRNVRTKGGRNIKLKPGQKKKVSFYVQGSTTWPIAKDFDIRFRIKYKGKIYTRRY